MDLFHKVPVDIPNKSGFDMSHSNYFTATCGTLVPALVEPLLPNDTINLNMFTQIQLPPMATDFYGDVDAKFEAFFVPYRLLYGGWQGVITRSTTNRTEQANLQYIPSFNLSSSEYSAGTLADYLGVKIPPGFESTSLTVPNILPFMAYHKIYEDWYRESRVQKELFVKPYNTANAIITSRVNVQTLPYINTISNTTSSGSTYPYQITSASDLLFNDGVSLGSLRQRNWSKDYFTNSTPRPQSGSASSLSFSIVNLNTDDTESFADSDLVGSFTISALRAANSLQRYMERNNIAGFRYADQIKATYGIYPSDAVLDRCVYLGSFNVPVITKSVFQQNQTSEGFNGDTSNPFSSVGTKFGASQGFAEGSFVDNFTTTEHGFLFVMFSLVPKAKYSTGTRRYLMESSQADIPNPLLQGVGDQEVYTYELAGMTSASGSVLLEPTVFSYSQRYSHYKFHNDEVHGLLRDGQNLQSFSLQRSFDSSVSLGSDFLQIPKNYMDQVTAVNGNMSQFGCWVQCGFQFYKSSTLSAYDIPTLGDMRNVHTELIDNGGRRL